MLLRSFYFYEYPNKIQKVLTLCFICYMISV